MEGESVAHRRRTLSTDDVLARGIQPRRSAAAKGEHEQAVRLSAEGVQLLTNLGDRFYLILAVEELARARLAGRHGHSVVRLFGAAHALRLASGALLSPYSRAENERDMTRVRAALGKQTFEHAWADGVHHLFDVLRDETKSGAHQASAAG